MEGDLHEACVAKDMADQGWFRDQNKGPVPFGIEPFTPDSAGHTAGSLTVFP